MFQAVPTGIRNKEMAQKRTQSITSEIMHAQKKLAQFFFFFYSFIYRNKKQFMSA